MKGRWTITKEDDGRTSDRRKELERQHNRIRLSLGFGPLPEKITRRGRVRALDEIREEQELITIGYGDAFSSFRVIEGGLGRPQSFDALNEEVDALYADLT